MQREREIDDSAMATAETDKPEEDFKIVKPLIYLNDIFL